MQAHDRYDARKITATFTDINGDNADPTAVIFTVVDPAGVTTTYTYITDPEVNKSAVGVYYLDLTLSLAGHYIVQWRGTGDIVSNGRYELYARRGI